MFSNYFFIFMLVAMWGLAFLVPTAKLKKKNVKRLMTLVRISTLWWIIGMTYHLLGFLLPTFLVPSAIDRLLSVTIALPCRLGIGVETVRSNSLNLPRFDLAWAMLWGLPFSFLCTSLMLAVQVAVKKQTAAPRQPWRA